MRVALCKGQLLGPVSGADEMIVSYATALHRAGHDVRVVLMYPHRRDDPFATRLQTSGVPLDTIDRTPRAASFESLRRAGVATMRALPMFSNLIRTRGRRVATALARSHEEACITYFKSTKPDVVYVNSPDPAAMVFIESASAAGVPVMYHEALTPYAPAGYEEMYARFAESAIPRCSMVAALSPRLAARCREELPGKPSTHVLPLIQDRPLIVDRSRLSAAGPVTIGYAARLDRDKGVFDLVDAFALHVNRSPKTLMRMIGAGRDRQKAVAHARKRGVGTRCTFEDPYTTVEGRDAFMKSIDIFVLPSYFEGTPNAIVEAMAHGVPVIASTAGGIPDVVTPACGRLITAGDVAGLASAMSEVVDDSTLRNRMGVEALKQFDRLFAREAVEPLLVDLLRTAASRDHQPQSLHPWAAVRHRL